MTPRFLFISAILFLGVISCKKEEEMVSCVDSPEIEIVKVQHSTTDQNNGTIEVSASGGMVPYELSIDNSDFTQANTFENLSADIYTIYIRDAKGCVDSVSQEVREVMEVSFKDEVKPVFDKNCLLSGCHGNRDDIPDWNDFEVIKVYLSTIRKRVEEGSMPPISSGISLKNDEIGVILDWIDQGAPNN